MGYLTNTVLEIDAILTNKGKELLSQGDNSFKIVQFALADDEIDYRLWNPDHNLGTGYFGEMIEQLPIVESVPDEKRVMKYKLVTLPITNDDSNNNTVLIPSVSLSTDYFFIQPGQTIAVIPTTINETDSINNNTYGYQLTLSDTTYLKLSVTKPAPGISDQVIYGLDGTATAIGLEFSVILLDKFRTTVEFGHQSIITLEGREVGGSTDATVTIGYAL